jgi:hypothetical protein
MEQNVDRIRRRGNAELRSMTAALLEELTA